MPRACSICHHLQRHAIDEALTAGEAFRNISKRFGTSVTALHRHKHEHLVGHLADVQQSQTPASAARDTQPMQQACTAPGQVSPPQRSPEAVQALQAYRTSVQEYEARQQTRQGWLPQDRTSIMVQLARRLEQARQRLAALDINPETLRGGEPPWP